MESIEDELLDKIIKYVSPGSTIKKDIHIELCKKPKNYDSKCNMHGCLECIEGFTDIKCGMCGFIGKHISGYYPADTAYHIDSKVDVRSIDGECISFLHISNGYYSAFDDSRLVAINRRNLKPGTSFQICDWCMVKMLTVGDAVMYFS